MPCMRRARGPGAGVRRFAPQDLEQMEYARTVRKRGFTAREYVRTVRKRILTGRNYAPAFLEQSSTGRDAIRTGSPVGGERPPESRTGRESAHVEK